MGLTPNWIGRPLMALLNFRKKGKDGHFDDPKVADFLRDFSIEVMPRTADKIENFRAILPASTRVYVAHIDGTPINDMVTTAKRLAAEGFRVMPHFPARIIANEAMLADWIARYQGEANINEALLLAGGVPQPVGTFDSSMQLLGTGQFDKAGFKRLHVAGHPEGNRDIDPTGGNANVEDALRWKNDFANRTDAEMAIVTQFAFEAGPIIEWAGAVQAAGITLPIHIGVAGPAKLQTLIKFAIACGIGPSLKVLQRRAMDVSKLVMPYEPDDIVTALAHHKAANPDFSITQLHLFPLGGIKTAAAWAGSRAAQPVAAADG